MVHHVLDEGDLDFKKWRFQKKKEKMVHGVVGLVEDDQIISSKVRETFHSNF